MNTFKSKQSISIAKNKIFIDGISRTGKSIFSTILPTFEKMEHIQFFDLVEWLVPATKYGGIKLDYAKSILNFSEPFPFPNIKTVFSLILSFGIS